MSRPALIRQALIARYSDQDDASLAAMAGEGLLRRAAKDVEAARVSLLEGDEQQLQLDADGQQVTLDARGWEHCRCSCPAPGWCKHKLAAVLYLRQLREQAPDLPETPGDDGALSSADPCPASSTDPSAAAVALGESPTLAELLALDSEEVLAQAGVAARRRLPALLAEAGEPLLEISSGSVVIALPGLATSVRYLRHGGYAGMYSEGPQSQRKALHLAALWTVWRRYGSAPQLADEEPIEELSSSEFNAFLDQLQGQLLALLSQGLGHLDGALLARLQALNIDARSEALPAIAARLRTLEGWAQRLARRDDAVREAEVLALMATTWAACAALRQADPEQRQRLAGGRREFITQEQPLELLVLGADWWQRASGARGLSLHLLALDGEQQGQILSATHARADASDPHFSRDICWTGAIFWRGMGSAEQIVEAGTLQLRGARISLDQRIALAGEVQGQRGPALRVDDPRGRSIGIDDWQSLGQRLRQRYSLFSPAIEHQLLRPSSQREPELDELRQCISWTLLDTQKRPLTLRMPCSGDYQDPLNALQHWSRQGGTLLVLVSIEREPELQLRPISLLLNVDGQWRCRPLQFSTPRKTAVLGNLSGRILRFLEQRRAAPSAPSPGIAARLLHPILEILISQATSGRPSLPASDSERLRSQATLLQAAGLDLLATAVGAYLLQPKGAELLRLHALIQLALGLSETVLDEVLS